MVFFYYYNFANLCLFLGLQRADCLCEGMEKEEEIGNITLHLMKKHGSLNNHRNLVLNKRS